MAGRVSIAALVLAVLLAALATAPAVAGEPETISSRILASYSFDDGDVETGPDTFRVFENSKGTVELSSAYRFSGYQSVEIREVARDGEFPELLGFFPLRREGMLYLHFALLVTDPAEDFNIALAGPRWFAMGRDGIGLWLGNRGGEFIHVSDSIPRKLFRIEPFTWYIVDVGYDAERGTYALLVRQEGVEEPVVGLLDQPNASSQPGSAVDKFSFIGDTGTDASNAVYYIDDVILSLDDLFRQPRFVAPGRRSYFVDRLGEFRRLKRRQHFCLPVADAADLGLDAEALGRFKTAGALDLLGRIAGGLTGGDRSPIRALEQGDRLLLAAVEQWAAGCREMEGDRPARALERFRAALEANPQGELFRLSTVLALARLGEWESADAELAGVGAAWRDDWRYALAGALVGAARGDIGEALAWLEGSLAEPLEVSAERHRLFEQHYFLLIWSEEHEEARRFAEEMMNRTGSSAGTPERWTERAADAAFFGGDLSGALKLYTAALRLEPERPALLLKLSDVYYRLGDLGEERRLRERIYGSLRTGH